MYSLRGVVLRLSNKRRANAAAEEAALSANRRAVIAALLLLFMPDGILLLRQARGNQSCNAIDRKLDDPDIKKRELHQSRELRLADFNVCSWSTLKAEKLKQEGFTDSVSYLCNSSGYSGWQVQPLSRFCCIYVYLSDQFLNLFLYRCLKCYIEKISRYAYIFVEKIVSMKMSEIAAKSTQQQPLFVFKMLHTDFI